jgi:hypothetical protein
MFGSESDGNAGRTGRRPTTIELRAIERLDSDRGRWAHEMLREFFERVLGAVKEDRRADAMKLM